MSYSAPSISAAGLSVASYPDILNDMLGGYQTIYGAAIYLGTETQKYQEISLFALKTYDVGLGLQLVYNARSPSTAIGSDLDAIVKLSGLVRKAASFSSAPGTVSGASGTTITNGTAVDVSGNSWSLPTTVTIPPSGSVVVSLICQTAGAVQASAGQINKIGAGATQGWTGISNPSPAVPGLPVEADSQLRGRQAFSVAIPSLTRLQGTIARIAATSGVTRSIVHENFTDVVDADGTPPHSISAVVEGGADTDIANAIYGNRGIGADMNGTTTVEVANPSGLLTPVSFSRPTYDQIFVSLSLTQLAGYSSALEASMLNALVVYLNSLQIGQIVTRSALFAVAMSVMPNFLTPQFAIETLTLGTAANPTGTADIVVAWNAVAQTNSGQIVITGG